MWIRWSSILSAAVAVVVVVVVAVVAVVVVVTVVAVTVVAVVAVILKWPPLPLVSIGCFAGERWLLFGAAENHQNPIMQRICCFC